MSDHQLGGNQGGNYLSLDGGFSGLPALYIIKEVFDRLAFDLKIDGEVKPCDVFQMIIGTGKGGIDALLYGRLRLTPSGAITAYAKLLEVMPTREAETEMEITANDEKFMAAFIEVLKEVGLSADAPLRDDTPSCQTVLLTISGANMAKCNPLRTYRAREQPTPSCTILDAARAVTSSPGLFHPVQIGTGANAWHSIDATTRYPNPIQELLRQAQDHFGRDQQVATILSVGAGKAKVNSLGEGNGSLNDVLRRLVEDCEGKHEEMHRRIKNSGVYFRLNVDRGLDEVSLRREESTSTIQDHTATYLQGDAVSDIANGLVTSLRLRRGRITVGRLNSIEVVTTVLRPPPSLVQNFIGRNHILSALYTTHFHLRLEELSGPILSLITGIGGVGKTQISVRLLIEYQKRFPDSPVYFVDARSKEQLEEDLQNIIRCLGDGYQCKTYKDALLWLSNAQKRWLIIYDNADDPSFGLKPYLPKSDEGHAIISSRNYDLREMAPANHHFVGGLLESDAVTLLLTSSHNDVNETNQQLAVDIAKGLGYLPLALAHAASFIYQNNCLDTFLDMYSQRRQMILSRMPKELPDDYTLSVSATIEMSFERLSLRAKCFLTLLSFFDITGVDREVLTDSAKRGFDYMNCRLRGSTPAEIRDLANELSEIFYVNHIWYEYDFHELIKECRQYSLLQENHSNSRITYSMHPLLQSWLYDNMGDEEKSHHWRLVVRLMSSFITKEDSYTYWASGRLIVSHLKHLPSGLVLSPEDNYIISWILYDYGDYRNARSRCQQVILDLESNSSQIPLETAKVTRLLATLTRFCGLSEEARKLAENVLSMQTQSLTEEDPETLLTMDEIGRCYIDLGLYKKALPLHENVLRTRLRVLGKENNYTIRAMSAISACLFHLGRHHEAMDMYTKILKMQKEALGDEHPNTLWTMRYLAYSFLHLGRYQEALDLNKEVLTLQKNVFGDEHPDSLHTMGGLATSLSELGQYREALEINKQVLKLWKNVFGDKHPETFRAMGGVARSLLQLGQYREALDMNKEVLGLLKNVCGSEHPDTLWIMGNLGCVFSDLGQYKEALNIRKELLELRKKVSGDEHPDTLRTMGNLAHSFSRLGQYQEALDINKEVLEKLKSVCGNEHPDTLWVMGNLACALSNLGQHKKALGIQKKVVELQKNVSGDEHPDTITATKNFAKFLHNLHRYREALPFYRYVLDTQRQTLGDRHPNTLDTMKCLIETLSCLGKRKSASKLRKELKKLTSTS